MPTETPPGGSALALTGQGPPTGDARAEEVELARLVQQVTALDAEVDELSLRLARFASDYEQRLRGAFAAADQKERLTARLRVLQDELDRLIALLEGPAGRREPPRAPRRTARARRAPEAGAPRYHWTAEEVGTEDRPSSAEEEAAALAAELEPEALSLKRLYRRLARLLHPDLAQTEQERERLHRLMSQVNAAYEKEDRATLELIAAKVGVGVMEEGISEAERLAHLRRRRATLQQVMSSLQRDLQRVRSSSTHRLYEELRRRAAEGRDYFAETEQELEEDAAQAAGDAWSRMARLEAAARELSALKQSLQQTSRSRRLRAFDPVAESPLIRLGVQHLERRRATPQARTLARELEQVAAQAPWHAALILQAFFAEVAGRPPDGLVSMEEWAGRYAQVSARWPDAPSFEDVLTSLPASLELGLRRQGDKVRFGLQLQAAELVAAVPIALERRTVAEIAREVLRNAGPEAPCPSCGEKRYLLHLLRTRGLDELHGLHCVHCGQLVRSYLLFNWGEGHESLWPYALQLGLAAEVAVKFATATVLFGLLPEARAALTARRLVDLFFELYVRPYGLDLHPMAVRVTLGKRALAANAPIPAGATPRLAFARGTEPSERDALELLRARIERRFKPR